MRPAQAGHGQGPGPARGPGAGPAAGDGRGAALRGRALPPGQGAQEPLGQFLPFETPNILFTSPDGKVEVFVRLVKETRFACILGEHITGAVDPVRLYRDVAAALYASRIIYIEVINDAADALSTECILRAGFVPCGYLPCLKQAGEKRRDYVVFARSYEYFTYPRLKVNSLYLDYLREYCKARAVDVDPGRLGGVMKSLRSCV